MCIKVGVFIARSELHRKARRGNSKKISTETMFAEQQMKNKLPMNKFSLTIRRTFPIINTFMFWKQIFSRSNGTKRSPNGLHGA